MNGSKMHLRIAAILILLLGLASCGNPAYLDEHSGSGISQLTARELKCHVWDTDRIDYLKANMPQGFVRNFPNTVLDEVLNALAGIPDPQLNLLYDVYNKKIFRGIEAAPGMQGGVTEFNRNPLQLKVGTSRAIIHAALQHEVGHAIYPFFWHQNLKGDGNEFKTLVQRDAISHASNAQLHPYPKSYFGRNNEVYGFEYWAEAYNSYYCSPESEAQVKRYFPSTYDVLERYLDPPVWRSGVRPPSPKFTIFASRKANEAQTIGLASEGHFVAMGLCKGDGESCTDMAQSLSTFVLDRRVGERQIFVAQDLNLGLTAETTFTIMAETTDGLIEKKTIKIQPVPPAQP